MREERGKLRSRNCYYSTQLTKDYKENIRVELEMKGKVQEMAKIKEEATKL